MILKVGDVVKLNSGGPAMTVMEADDIDPDHEGDQSLVCTWFDAKHETKSGHFSAATLTRVGAAAPRLV